MLYPVKVRPLPWWGGKQARGKCEWIAALLPWEWETLYVEPFGGMASVMARRAPVKREIYNDLDGRAVNWFRVLQSRPEELDHLVLTTPKSRQEYERALGTLDSPDELHRAWAFHVVTDQGLVPSPERTDWLVTKSLSKGSVGRWKSGRITELFDRFSNVQLENKDAVELLVWIQECDYAVVYCDPPYHSSDVSPYQMGKVDLHTLTNVLLRQQGKVAISGYGDEWSHLGWERHQMQSNFVFNGANRISEPRTEVLWTNYDAHAEQAIGGLFQ